MKFTDQQIAIACDLRKHGLQWEPAVGHYVLDQTGFCKQSSPFQDRVYFILNYDHFMRIVGGVERFKEIMFWLPTWRDCREILCSLGVSSQQVQSKIIENNAIGDDRELTLLYELILSSLLSVKQPSNTSTSDR